VKDRQSWQPSKFIESKSGWVGSRDPRELGIQSRLIGDILARVYFQAIRAHVSGLLLDLGCGKVPLYGMYRDLITESICIDWEGSFHVNPHIDHFVDLNGPLPIEDGKIDTILSTDVLEHIARPDCMWAEMSRVLRPGGKLILGTPFLYWLHEEPHDYHRFTAHKLRMFCGDYGLEVIELSAYGGAPEVVFDILCKQLYRPRLAAIWARTSQWLLSRARIQRISARTRNLFPLGYCLIARKHP
jgi:SAM-dependent methyltransferase